MHLQSLYLFRDRFGWPGEGKVEALVKTARRRFMVPIPKVASAIVSSILDLRARILASQGSFVAPRRAAQPTTDIAPTINSRRRSPWPIFDILPSLGLPPVVCCRGTSPNRPRSRGRVGGSPSAVRRPGLPLR